MSPDDDIFFSRMKKITGLRLIVTTSVFLAIFYNFSFFHSVFAVYTPTLKNSAFLLSLLVMIVCINLILFSLLCTRHLIKPVLISVLLISAIAAFFMDTYQVIIDDSMIDNIVKTDVAESLELVSIRLLLYLFLLGMLPAFFVYKADIVKQTFLPALFSRVKLMACAVLVTVITVFLFGSYYASFLRVHKPLRYHINPAYYLYSSGKYLGKQYKHADAELEKIGLDAAIPASDVDRELFVLVVGETARADHFSLNGYSRKTNPYLEKQQVISFNNTWACGTSTAVSVPCMFSIHGRRDFNTNETENTENVLDILQRAGVNVLWLDANSSSKGVAVRVPYQSYKTADSNSVCDIECRDEGMLNNLQDYIDKHKQGDIFIVLHQMGNHGPAYYKRYPPAFEIFKPGCMTNELEQCSLKEINNTYDNAILYTDYFLSKTINLLKRNSKEFESILFYISDHGESLGENGLYLHGLPYAIAPESQKHVPMIMWFGENFDTREEVSYRSLQGKTDNLYSHDNVFHTILGLMEVNTGVYNEAMDIIRH